MQNRRPKQKQPVDSFDVNQLVASARPSLAELAETCGISRQRVHQLLKKGRTPAQIVAERTGSVRPARSVALDRPEPVETLNQTRQRKESLLARKHALDLAEREGTLIASSKVIQFYGDKIVKFRNAMLSIPSETADRIAAETDPAKVRMLLEGEIRNALNLLGRAEDLRDA